MVSLIMDDIEEEEEELRSLPCSAPEAKAGLRTFVQLYLVNDGLEKNPVPREDFYRQYSETSEPQTPTDEPITPPLTYEESLQESKDLAARVAKGIKQFYEGRVLLRREEAEQQEDLEQDLNYWNSKIKQWRDFVWPLLLEVEKRKRKELDGEAEEGYAEAMLLSPVQPPSAAPLDCGSQSPARPAKERSQSTSGYNNNDLPTLLKSQKRKHSEVDDTEEMPQSLPCSAPEAKIGLRTIVQLHLVNEGLERNPEPREDFYRQESITPDIQGLRGKCCQRSQTIPCWASNASERRGRATWGPRTRPRILDLKGISMARIRDGLLCRVAQKEEDGAENGSRKGICRRTAFEPRTIAVSCTLRSSAFRKYATVRAICCYKQRVARQ